MTDPFDHPNVGTVVTINLGKPFGIVTWTCTAWADNGSQWHYSDTGLHYTNNHEVWKKILGPKYPDGRIYARKI